MEDWKNKRYLWKQGQKKEHVEKSIKYIYLFGVPVDQESENEAGNNIWRINNWVAPVNTSKNIIMTWYKTLE